MMADLIVNAMRKRLVTEVEQEELAAAGMQQTKRLRQVFGKFFTRRSVKKMYKKKKIANLL